MTNDCLPKKILQNAKKVEQTSERVNLFNAATANYYDLIFISLKNFVKKKCFSNSYYV